VICRFHCDLSYDGSPPGKVKGRKHIPSTYVFAGFFADQDAWDFIEREWKRVNDDFGVLRFHASHLNFKTHEYEGWDDLKKIEYSAKLLGILGKAGKSLSAVSCGMFADDYREMISAEGQRKMGSPYIACFNSCITRVARAMDERGFPAGIKFSALIDEDDEYLLAIDRFNKIRDDPKFQHRSRMATCTPGKMESIPALQPADLIAYEVYRWMMEVRQHPERNNPPKRYPLKHLLKNNGVSEGYWDRRSFTRMKDAIESTPSIDGGLVIIPEN
jgi:hypothetical protein